MVSSLYEHNQIAYEAAKEMMNRTGKAAVIHPTGTGKSFIGFALAAEHPDCKLLWLAPSEYIFHTQLENAEKIFTGEETADFSNIEFLSYSRLMRNEASIDTLHPDYIILDEFHRCGATRWGSSVRRLLAACKKSRLLGLSATNVRYLDNQRDMAEELFDGNIASEMTLGEAIARGILSAPKYVIAMYGYQKEFYRLQKRVLAEETNTARAEKSAELFEQLKRALEQADGMDQIYEKHMKNRHGKYIVFCADRKHMDEMISRVPDWFALVDREPHVYRAYYNNPETSRDFSAFKEDHSAHLKLLFCIDMLNEGIHVADIDGVILLRPTVSPIIFLQQIGRCLSAGAAAQPVIFDMVRNFEGLYSIDYLEKEIEEAFALLPADYVKKEHWKERFQVVDEVGDCRRLFGELKRSLTLSWEDSYRAACWYYQKEGSLRIPKTYVTPEGIPLGSWIQTQRKVYAGKAEGSLTPDKIAKLEAIGMIWDAKEDKNNEAFAEIQAYYERYGNLDIKARYVTESGFPLGRWVSRLRTEVRKSGTSQVLTEEQQRYLNGHGMIWNPNGARWEQYLKAARAYKDKYGDLKIPKKYVTEDGLALGSWFHSLKHGKSGEKARCDTLTDKQRRQLEELGVIWKKDSDVLWNTKFQLAREYYELHGNLDIPVAYCVGGVRLGRWISNIRCKRRNPKASGMVLDDGRIRQLDSIGMNWK